MKQETFQFEYHRNQEVDVMMKAVKLSNGVSMPMEGFGVFQIPEKECEQVVRNAVESGYRLIDTASSYQNEEAVGRALQTCGVPREELFITTKAYIQEMGYDNTMKAFEESMKKLGLDYLDLYLIHMPFGDYYGSWRPWKSCIGQGGSGLLESAIFCRTVCWTSAITWKSNRRSTRLSVTHITIVQKICS